MEYLLQEIPIFCGVFLTRLFFADVHSCHKRTGNPFQHKYMEVGFLFVVWVWFVGGVFFKLFSVLFPSLQTSYSSKKLLMWKVEVFSQTTCNSD